jgi:hypothetical protein
MNYLQPHIFTINVDCISPGMRFNFFCNTRRAASLLNGNAITILQQDMDYREQCKYIKAFEEETKYKYLVR